MTHFDSLRAEVDTILEKRRGQLPTWYRRRDAIAEVVNRMGGGRSSNRTLCRIRFVVDRGCDALRQAMDDKTISIAAAAEVAKGDHEFQRKWLGVPRQRQRHVVRVLRGLE
jgi:hypothetical protein